jgi:hypothetical protein
VIGIANGVYYSSETDGVYVTVEIEPETPTPGEMVKIILHLQNLSSFEAIDVEDMRIMTSIDTGQIILPMQNPHKGHYEEYYTFPQEGKYTVKYTFQYEGQLHGDEFFIDVKSNYNWVYMILLPVILLFIIIAVYRMK